MKATKNSGFFQIGDMVNGNKGMHGVITELKPCTSWPTCRSRYRNAGICGGHKRVVSGMMCCLFFRVDKNGGMYLGISSEHVPT